MNGEPIADWIRDSTYVGQKTEGQSSSVIQIETSKLLPWIILACLLAGTALGISIMNVTLTSERFSNMEERYRMAEREARVATERVADMKVELIRRGIPASDH